MKLGRVQYFLWPVGSSCPCDVESTLKAAKKAAAKCEGKGGAKHEFFRVQKVRG